MANDPRSSRKSKDEETDSSRKKPVVGKGLSTSASEKTETSGLRRSTRETPSKVPMSSSPSTSRKSERLEKKPITPSKRKIDLVEKQETVSPLRRSDRAKKQQSSSSSGSKKSDKGSGSADDRGNKLEKEKSVKQSQEAQEISRSKKQHPKTTGVKKRMDARTYKSLFKEQRRRASRQEFNEESGRPVKLSQGEENCVGASVSKLGREEDESHGTTESRREELGEEDIDQNCEGAFKSSHIVERSFIAEELESNTNAEELEASCSIEKHHDINLGTSGTAASKGKTYPDEECAPTDTYTSSPLPSRCKRDDYVTACVACNKRKRVDYYSLQQELCFCGSTMEKHLQSIPSSKDRSDNQSSARDWVDKDECNAGMDSPSDVTCVVCKLDGKLLRCGGKGCMRSFHISCLDPPLDDALPAQFHCVICAKRKIESGVYSVTEGIESIWDTREVEVRDTEGLGKQKQYFVKYRGLSHIYNHWVPEAQLLLEAPNLVSDFNMKKQVTEWREDWMVPQRLLKRRSLRCPGDQNDSNNDHHGDIDCHYEWLVKWRGLDYEHATWEVDNADFLCSSQGQRLVEEFSSRRERAKKAASVSTADKSKKASLVQPTELLSNVFDYDHVNKLHEHWHKGENAIVINDQERIAKVILFILSLVPDACQPFLVITSSCVLSLWEAEFARLAPSADVVVYSGNEDNRKIIRSFEFYDERGCIMLQVLLSSVEAIVKDLDDLECIRWEAIVVDECQHPGVSENFEQIKRLTSDVRVLLFNDQLKDSMAEHLNLLLLLETSSNLDCGSASRFPLKSDRRKLSERLSHFIAYDCSSDSSRFLEYWVPVLISDVQLEQYCAALLTNHTCLRSHLKNDLIGALHDILISVRKCCDHPFMLDGSLQDLMLKDRAPAEYLDVGIKASGKLELLDTILSEMKNRGLRAVIIFQPIGGSGRDTMGNILDDFVRQRFGVDSYERLDGGYLPTKKKQAALDKFNDKGGGTFVFLLENRACQYSVKLSSVDAIIIYDSDWNPINDLRALNKLSISPSSGKIKVFRLYTSCTVEERVLDLTTCNVTLDSNLHGVGPSTSHMLLMWGASYLFSKLHEFHGGDSSSTSSRTSADLSLQNDVGKEFLALLCQEGKNVYTNNSLIIKVRQVGTKYSKTASLLGERKVQLVDNDDPRLFWTNLLEGKNPRWRYPSGLSQRNRKRAKNFDDLPNKPDGDAEESRKKRMKLVNNGADPASHRPSSSEDNLIGRKEGDSEARVSNGVQHSPKSSAGVTHTTHASTSCLNSNGISSPREVDTSNPSDRLVLRDAQMNLLELLRPEISKLCEILHLPQDVKVVLGRFLEFVVENHRISREPASIFQAFQISVCWIATSLRKYKLDKKESFALVKQKLNFSCTEEEAQNVYTRLRHLKRRFLCHLENLKESDSSKDSVSLADDILMEQPDARKLPSNPQTIKVEVEERSENQDIGDDGLLQQQVLKQAGKPGARMKKVMQKQQEEFQMFQITWEKEREQIEKDYDLEVALVRSMYRNIPALTDKIKKVNEKFSKKREEHAAQKVSRLKDIQAKQLAERRQERQKSAPNSESMQAGVITMVLPDTPEAATNEALSCPATIVTPTMSPGRNHEDAHHSTNLPSVVLAGSENISNLQSSSSAHRENNFVILLPSVERESDAASLREREFPESSLKEVADGSEPNGVVSPDLESNKACNHQDDVIGSSTNSVCIENPLAQSPLMQPTVTSPETSTVPQRVDECLASLATGVRGVEEPAGENQNVLEEGEGQSLSPVISEQADQTNQEAVVIEHEDRPACGTQDIPPQVEHQASHPADSTPTEQTNHDPQTIPAQQSEDTTNIAITPPPVHATDVHASHNQPDVELAVNSQPRNEGYTPFQNAEGPSQLVENTDRIPEHQSNILPPIHTNDACPLPSQPDMALGDGIENQLDSEGYTSFLTTQGSQYLAEDLAGLPNQGSFGTQLGMPPAIDIPLGEFGMNLPLQSARQAAPRMAAQHVYGDPLQNELERIRKETELAMKIHKDSTMQLQSERDKEIENIIAEIRRKYDAKLQAAEAAFVLKKKELDMNHEQVLLNKILAEAFRSKFLDIRPSGGSGMQQAMPSSFMQQMHLLSSHAPPPGRPSPVSQSASPVANPNGHQTVVSTPNHYSSAHASSMPNRPLHGGVQANLPSGSPSGNRQLTGEIRAPAPHLQQRFRPSPSMTALSSPRTMLSQQMQHTFPRTPVVPVAQPRAPQPSMAVWQGNQTMLSPVENHRTAMPNNSTFPGELVANFGSLNMAQFSGPDASNHNSTTISGAAADIVCLSDDE